MRTKLCHYEQKQQHSFRLTIFLESYCRGSFAFGETQALGVREDVGLVTDADLARQTLNARLVDERESHVDYSNLIEYATIISGREAHEPPDGV